METAQFYFVRVRGKLLAQELEHGVPYVYVTASSRPDQDYIGGAETAVAVFDNWADARECLITERKLRSGNPLNCVPQED